MKIQILIYDGFDELDAIAPFEVLHAATTLGADLQVEMVTLDGAEMVTAQHGLRVGATGTFDEATDIVLIPGGGWNARTPQGARTEAERGTIPQALARLHGQGKTLASVCTGAMLIATAGLLNGRHAITHHQAIEDLRASGALVINARVVDDGEIISAGGVTSGLDLALWLVERYYGPEMALSIEERLEYQRRGTVWRQAR
jgi:transcriptional regulator GlxA family with amidase domain